MVFKGRSWPQCWGIIHHCLRACLAPVAADIHLSRLGPSPRSNGLPQKEILQTNFPSRPASGAPQDRQVISRLSQPSWR